MIRHISLLRGEFLHVPIARGGFATAAIPGQDDTRHHLIFAALIRRVAPSWVSERQKTRVSNILKRELPESSVSELHNNNTQLQTKLDTLYKKFAICQYILIYS